MPEPLAIFGAVGGTIALAAKLIQTIDLVIGCCTKNTPVAALWLELLSGLRTEIIHAQDQLRLVKGEVEPMRIRRGSGADAANRKRQEVGFEELIQEFALQLQASENVLLTATNGFQDQGRFDWALLEAFDTTARNLTAPIKNHCKELKSIRCRVHNARESIINAFILNLHDTTGGHFPTLESLGHIRDELAHKFLWPDPFCKTFEPDDALAAGLLLCNKDDLTLDELRKRIQQMGVHWVHAVRYDAANRDYKRRYVDHDAASNYFQHRTSTVDVLEECQDKILVQLKGVFKAIIKDCTPFTPNDHLTATRGQYILDEWSSVCVAADGGIVIAIGGKMSAGKSSIINAMLGQSLLPTAKRVCTAVPSRLRHVSGQIEPTLSIPWVDPYIECLEWLEAQELSNNYRHSPLPDRIKKWADFQDQDPDGSAMLAKIEANRLSMLKADTKGQEAIDQMEFLNSLVRICRMFGKEVDMGHPDDWPILSVEFAGLKYYCQNLPGPFTLLDLPGYNDDIEKDTKRFTQLMDRAARQADVMVPVIAGPTIVQTTKWAEHTIRTEWRNKISSVIITKRDLVARLGMLRRHLPVVASKCDIPNDQDCILLCDTPQGMAAMKLQLFLDEIERKYATDPIPLATAEVDKRLQNETAILIAGITDESNPFHRALDQLYKEDSDPKHFTAFTFNDWRDLVEKCLVSSQLRQTCDKFAANTIEEARRLRLARFLGEMEEILDDLVSSLSDTLGLNRASINELYKTQSQTEKALSDLRCVLSQWTPRIEEVRAQQEGKLNEVLRRFERAAKDSADEAFELSVGSIRLDGGVYLLGKGRKAERIIENCRATVLGRLTPVVDDTIRDLDELWKENQDAVLSLLRDATVDIETHPQLAELIKNTINELEKVKRLDPEKLRIAMSGTPGEVVVDATSKKLWRLIRMRPAIQTQAPEENKRTGPFFMLQKFIRSGGPKTIGSQSAPTTPAPVSPFSTPVACPDVSVASEDTSSESPETDFAGLAVAMLSANMAEKLRATVSALQGSIPTLQEIAMAAGGNLSDNEGVKNTGPLKLTHEVLHKCVLATSLEPLISRVKAGAQSSMTESLNEMGALVQRAALGALEECYKVAERRLKALESEDTKQFRAETLERLACWGNLVAAQGAIQEMKRIRNEPVARVAPSRPSSSLLVTSPGSSSPSPWSPSSSITSVVSPSSYF